MICDLNATKIAIKNFSKAPFAELEKAPQQVID